jgi:hypothetical protein
MQNLTGGISVFNLWKSKKDPEKLCKAYDKLLLEHKLGVLHCAKSGSRKIFVGGQLFNYILVNFETKNRANFKTHLEIL